MRIIYTVNVNEFVWQRQRSRFIARWLHTCRTQLNDCKIYGRNLYFAETRANENEFDLGCNVTFGFVDILRFGCFYFIYFFCTDFVIPIHLIRTKCLNFECCLFIESIIKSGHQIRTTDVLFICNESNELAHVCVALSIVSCFTNYVIGDKLLISWLFGPLIYIVCWLSTCQRICNITFNHESDCIR